MRSLLYVLIIVLFLEGLLSSGCLTPSSSTPPPPVTSLSSQIRAVVIGIHDEWSLSLGCYTEVTGYVDNKGPSTVQDAIVYLSLTYPGGLIRDLASLDLGLIEPQESRNFQVILDRECWDDYAIDFKFSGLTDTDVTR